MEYPYQIVAFFGEEPEIGDLVYQGPNGWFPQLTLKRRFALVDISENDLMALLENLAKSAEAFDVKFVDQARPEHMPLDVVEVDKTEELLQFHQVLLTSLGTHIRSKYLDREGANYYPHMTIEWHGELVVDPNQFANSSAPVDRFWLIKDTQSSDSVTLAQFILKKR